MRSPKPGVRSTRQRHRITLSAAATAHSNNATCREKETCAGGGYAHSHCSARRSLRCRQRGGGVRHLDLRLGSNAFGAGITPPPGIYVSEAFGFYEGTISRPVPFGRVVLNAGATIDGFVSRHQLPLCAPVEGARRQYRPGPDTSRWPRRYRRDFAGPLRLVSVSRTTEGWGFGDIVPKSSDRMAARRFLPHALSAGRRSHGSMAARLLADHRTASPRRRYRLGLHLDRSGQEAPAQWRRRVHLQL